LHVEASIEKSKRHRAYGKLAALTGVPYTRPDGEASAIKQKWALRFSTNKLVAEKRRTTEQSTVETSGPMDPSLYDLQIGARVERVAGGRFFWVVNSRQRIASSLCTHRGSGQTCRRYASAMRYSRNRAVRECIQPLARHCPVYWPWEPREWRLASVAACLKNCPAKVSTKRPQISCSTIQRFNVAFSLVRRRSGRLRRT
jgi:hypothetical protein